MNLLILKTELLSGHPDTGMYDSNDLLASIQLNFKNRTRNIISLTGSEILNVIVKTDFNNLSVNDQQRIWNILHLEVINPFGIEAAMFVDIFGSNSNTITTLKLLRKENISRATEIGLNKIKTGDVERARDL